MNEFLQDSVFFGVFISIVTYEIGALIKRKWNVAIFNPLLISIALIIIFLILFDVDYDTYEFGAKYLSYFIIFFENMSKAMHRKWLKLRRFVQKKSGLDLQVA